MSCIVFNGNRYLIGADFADTVSNAPRSHGMFSHNKSEQRYLWQSTLSQQDAERVLRASLAAEHKRLTFIRSQAVSESDA